MTEAISESVADALARLCADRGRAYRLLSRTFEREVDAAFAEHLAAPDAFESDDKELLRLFGEVQAGVSDRSERALEELAVDFDRVFFGMGPLASEKAFPYESVYTSDKGLMMQDAYSEVRKEYRERGVAKNPAFTEPDDHLAVELAFLATCCETAAEALSARDASAAEASLVVQRSFLEKHLLNWTPAFAADVRRANGGFYAAAADFLVAFLRADDDVLREVVS